MRCSPARSCNPRRLYADTEVVDHVAVHGERALQDGNHCARSNDVLRGAAHKLALSGGRSDRAGCGILPRQLHQQHLHAAPDEGIRVVEVRFRARRHDVLAGHPGATHRGTPGRCLWRQTHGHDWCRLRTARIFWAQHDDWQPVPVLSIDRRTDGRRWRDDDGGDLQSPGCPAIRPRSRRRACHRRLCGAGRSGGLRPVSG